MISLYECTFTVHEVQNVHKVFNFKPRIVHKVPALKTLII